MLKEGIYEDNEHISMDEFNACATDADIILDACSTGVGDISIAKVIAEQNPTRICTRCPPFFSKPVFKIKKWNNKSGSRDSWLCYPERL